jgi:hypothetical protein
VHAYTRKDQEAGPLVQRSLPSCVITKEAAPPFARFSKGGDLDHGTKGRSAFVATSGPITHTATVTVIVQ